MAKKRWLHNVAPLLLVAAAALMQACLGPPFVAAGIAIDVGGPPPGVRGEVRIAAPGPEFVWVPGFWDWSGSQWLWIGGAWQHPPHPRARWIAPRYRRHSGHWQYYRGHWS